LLIKSVDTKPVLLYLQLYAAEGNDHSLDQTKRELTAKSKFPKKNVTG